MSSHQSSSRQTGQNPQQSGRARPERLPPLLPYPESGVPGSAGHKSALEAYLRVEKQHDEARERLGPIPRLDECGVRGSAGYKRALENRDWLKQRYLEIGLDLTEEEREEPPPEPAPAPAPPRDPRDISGSAALARREQQRYEKERQDRQAAIEAEGGSSAGRFTRDEREQAVHSAYRRQSQDDLNRVWRSRGF